MDFYEVLDGLKREDIIALEWVIERYSNLIFKVAYGVLGNRESAEECVNDVCLKVWMHGKKFEGNQNRFKNWVCTIAKYTAIDKLRREINHDKNVSLEENEGLNVVVGAREVEDLAINREELLKIKGEINNMKEIDREIFIRKFYYCEGIREISEKIGISENAVSLRILRGRKAISMKLENKNK